ncbi:hypothetical protein CLAIMM_06705 [Cladophialophora immunda]|nr:hypothetical protein CLAIMM_06705 [Cladophialophora immunda]
MLRPYLCCPAWILEDRLQPILAQVVEDMLIHERVEGQRAVERTSLRNDFSESSRSSLKIWESYTNIRDNHIHRFAVVVLQLRSHVEMAYSRRDCLRNQCRGAWETSAIQELQETVLSSTSSIVLRQMNCSSIFRKQGQLQQIEHVFVANSAVLECAIDRVAKQHSTLCFFAKCFRVPWDRLSATANGKERASDDEEPIRADKRRRTDNGSENRSDSERERQEGRRRKSPSNDVRKEPESQVDRSHSDQNPRNIGPPTVGNDVTHIMSTDNMTPTQQEEPSSRTLEPRHRDKRTRRLSAGFIEVRTKVPVQRRNQVDNGDEKGPLFDLSYLDRSRYNALHPPVPTDLMESEMGILEHGIFSTIAVYADALSIPEDQPMILDTRLRYPDECRLLFDLMLGLDSFRGANSRSETFLAFQQSRTSLIDFLRSFVGCALTNWCLSWPSNPTSYFRGLDDGTVDTVLKEAFTPEIEAEVRQRLWEEHMSVHKVPTIENKAHHMASTLLAYIDMLIPNDPPERRPSEHTDVCRLPEDDPTQNSSQPDGPAPPLRESPDRKALRDSLVTIFKNGLKFQIQMFKNLNAEYVVLWPRFLRPYERKLNRARRARGSSADTDADAGEPKKPVVRLGLMPLIQRRTRGYIHHAKWSEFQLVTKGSVLAL